MQPTQDEIVAGKYRLARLIGRGGMGTVWEGVHVTLGTRVAVKFIDVTVAESPEARQRFENEARAAAKLNSKYAVQVYDHGMMEDGRPFIVMEYLTGEPLDARLDREGRISPIETGRIISQVSRALARAHAAGIVHRDLKPENIFLVWDDEDQADVAKVVDFGIAKFTGNQLGVSSSTRTGSLLGTPYFMSPEQARGLRTVDFRTDLWSLGVIAYRCITGELPFDGVSIGDLLVKICTVEVPVPSKLFTGCPAGFDEWTARAMQREPEHRFASVQELAEQLTAVCGGVRGSFATGHSHDVHRMETSVPLQDGVATPDGQMTLDQASLGRAVPGITAVAAATSTGDVFARTSPIPAKKRLSIWIFAAVFALFLLVAGALAMSRSDSVSGSTTAVPAVQNGVSNPSIAEVPATTAQLSPTSMAVAPAATPLVANAGSASPSASGEAPARMPIPQVGQKGPLPQANRNPRVTATGAVVTPRRPNPSDNKPIDVGY